MSAVLRTVVAVAVFAVTASASPAYASSPPAPRGVTATVTESSITLNWLDRQPKRTNIYLAQLLRSGEVVRTVRARSERIAIEGVDANTVYVLRVREIAGKFRSPWSIPLTTLTAPSAPASVTHSADESSVTLSWPPVEGATRYVVTKNGEPLETVVASSTVVRGLQPETDYSFGIASVSPSGSTSGTTSVTVRTAAEPPPVFSRPGSPVLGSVDPVSAVLSWAIPQDLRTTRVRLTDARGSELSVIDVAAPIAFTRVTGLRANSTYFVGIQQIFSNGVSDVSTLTQITTPRPAPQGVVVADIQRTSATVRWTLVPGALYYDVFVNGTFVARTSDSTIDHQRITVTAGTSYSVTIRSHFQDSANALTTSDFSAPVTFVAAPDPTLSPSALSAPVITVVGSNAAPFVGASLVASTGTWSSSVPITSFLFQWQRSSNGTIWFDIPGATLSSYTPTPLDMMQRLRVRVTAVSANGSSISDGSASLPVTAMANLNLPQLLGVLSVGARMEVTDGTWQSTFPLTFSYQWNRNGTPIPNAVAPSYTLVDADVDAAISVTVTARSSLGSLSATTSSRGSVGAVAATVNPEISGTLRVGSTLAATRGTWINSPSSYSYQWQSSADGTEWTVIPGANSDTHTLTSAELSRRIRVQVTAEKTISGTIYRTTANSAPTSAVQEQIIVIVTNTRLPEVTGAWSVGTTFTASSGTWSTNGAFSYQWQSSSDALIWADILGATSPTYTVLASDSGKFVRVVVTNTTMAGGSVASSRPTGRVDSPFCTTAPALTGVVRVGVSQIVTTPICSGSPVFSYQWQSSQDGIFWQDVMGATAATYAPTLDVADSQVRVLVTASNSVGANVFASQVLQGFLPPVATTSPTLSISDASPTNGPTLVGDTVTATSGSWPSTSSGYQYQWQRSSDGGATWTNIPGAASSSYTILTRDLGFVLRVVVAVSTRAGTSTAYSAQTVPIS